ncbi:hypothetical protein F5884DRAFT_791630 [Xylogone sp. PMI_703]|nr:hypothetical protein F5884DRAFT_791630 [Xylogone sp. PMI_703]
MIYCVNRCLRGGPPAPGVFCLGHVRLITLAARSYVITASSTIIVQLDGPNRKVFVYSTCTQSVSPSCGFQLLSALRRFQSLSTFTALVLFVSFPISVSQIVSPFLGPCFPGLLLSLCGSVCVCVVAVKLAPLTFMTGGY